MNNLYKVTSDNYTNQLMTKEAYAEFRLQMSTGDFHTHTAELVDVSNIDANSLDNILTVDDMVDGEQLDDEYFSTYR